MLTFFCPHCWQRVPDAAPQCPHCGFDLQEAAKMSYDEQLVLALRHSVTEYRIVAARILGRHGAAIALPEFKRIVEADNDYYLLREILYALLNIHDPMSLEIMRAAAHHPSRLVAQLAQELLTSIVHQQDENDALTPGPSPDRAGFAQH